MSDKTNIKGLVAWFANNHVAANILMVFFIIAGLGSVFTAVKETFPSIDPRIITITVLYPGATPEDVESGITRRIEEAVLGIQGIKRVESNAFEGAGTVIVELEDFVDGEEVLNDVETEVDSLSDFPPENAEQITIVKTKVQSRVLSIVLYGEMSELSLRTWAEIVEDGLEQQPDISLVDIYGSKAREISIEVPENLLRKYNLSMDQVANAISAFSVDLPAGNLSTASSEISIRVQNRNYYAPEFLDTVIKSNTDGSLLKLKDIATIRDSLEDVDLITRYNGKPAIFLDVLRTKSQDTIKIDKQVKSYLETLELPEELQTQIWKNGTDILNDRISLLTRNAIMGYALVFLAMLLFLDLKLAFWTSLGIPISFLGGIFIATFFGVTINMISLFALIVVLGIVVDDAIVTGESIFSEQQEGKKGIKATLTGVKFIQAPVTIGVLTTIAAFSPLIFSTGTLGQILRPVPIIVISVLFLSLIEAFLILPAHLSSSERWSLGYLAKIRYAVTDILEKFIDRILSPLVHIAIKARYLTVIAIFMIVGFGIAQFPLGNIKFIFFPQIESDDIRMQLEMPVGTSFETTRKYTERIYKAALEVEESMGGTKENPVFKNISTLIGATAGDQGGPDGGETAKNATHRAEINIELVPSNKRKVSAGEIEKNWRENVGEIPQVKNISYQSSLISAGADINIELSHRNDEILDKASEDLKRYMEDINGLSEVIDSLEPGKKEFIFELTDTGKAAGLSPTYIGRQLRDYFYGREIDRIQRGSNEIKVMVRYPKQARETLSTIGNMRLRLPEGGEAPLSAMAIIKERYSPSTIKRVDGRRVVRITANVDESILTPDEAIANIVENKFRALQENYPALKYQLAGQNKDQRDDLATLGKNMLIALMLIFVMLGSQLRSYIKPFVIILTVPLGIVGAIFGHLLLGFNLSFISLFGMVALTGVVINDSVVLIDYYNRLQAQGERAYDAAMASVKRRFRPILLTTLTTSLGLLPILLETSLQAQFIIPMAVSLACGIVFASALLIFLIPALLVIVEDLDKINPFTKNNHT